MTRKSTVKIYQCKKWMGGFLTKYKTTEWLLYNKFQIALRKVKTKCITTHSTPVLVMYDVVQLHANQCSHANQCPSSKVLSIGKCVGNGPSYHWKKLTWYACRPVAGLCVRARVCGGDNNHPPTHTHTYKIM